MRIAIKRAKERLLRMVKNKGSEVLYRNIREYQESKNDEWPHNYMIMVFKSSEQDAEKINRARRMSSLARVQNKEYPSFRIFM